MRSKINLATQPYEDARRFYLQWGGLVLALVIITAVLIAIVVRSHRASSDIAKKVTLERGQIEEIDRERGAAEAMLNRVENRDVRDKSRFLNALIVRKAFSWTQVFSDLERIVPPRVRIVSIRPDLNSNYQLEMHLEAIGDSREKANELLRHLEDSPSFREPQLRSERPTDSPGGASGIDFSIVALYVPQIKQENR